MQDKIQKILSSRGISSRRKAEELIAEGRVTCNGRVCVIGDRADPETDVISVDGVRLPSQGSRVYMMLNKPRGYVTTLSDEKGRKNAAQLVADSGVRVYPVGRLDMDSEGLLLFTNDGDFANTLMHPKHEIEKTYRVWVTGFTQDGLGLLRQSIVLDGYRIRPPKVFLESVDADKACLTVTIHEGRNRQVRRMCAAAGMTVQRLQRISEGSLKLGDLPVGKWRHLTDEEVEKLLHLI